MRFEIRSHSESQANLKLVTIILLPLQRAGITVVCHFSAGITGVYHFSLLFIFTLLFQSQQSCEFHSKESHTCFVYELTQGLENGVGEGQGWLARRNGSSCSSGVLCSSACGFPVDQLLAHTHVLHPLF